MGKAQHTFAAGRRLHLAGKTGQAEKIYRRILARDPEHPDALNALGVLAFQDRRLDEAADLIRRAIGKNPSDPAYYHNLGKVLQDAKRTSEAIAALAEAVRRDPGDVEALVDLARLQCRNGDPEQGIASFREALASRPDSPEACSQLGRLLYTQGRVGDATVWLRRAVELQPENPDYLAHLGTALLEQGGDEEEAIALCERALRRKRELPETLHNLGMARTRQCRFPEAMACFDEALRLRPGYSKPTYGVGAARLLRGEIGEAIAAFREALRLEPGFIAARDNLLMALNYDPSQDPDDVLAEHRRWDERHGAPLAAARRPLTNDPSPERRLRIGYVSADFRAHSVVFFFGGILAAHDRRHFECFCYNNTLKPDSTTQKLRALADQWRDVTGSGDEPLAETIRRDRIDILVDLSGHTTGNRLPVFARKPAPIQITYIGYPNTTGLSAMDYRITDAWADPPGQTERWHSEELVRLSSGFLCYQPPENIPAVNDLPALQGATFTFGSFNNVSKVTPEVVAAWAAILRAVPDSRLLLKSKALLDEGTRHRFQEMFHRHGVAPERIEALPYAANMAEHLGAYGQIDLALDPFPYNGTTTTCEALWMGVPVITLAGTTHVSRVGLSLLTRMGLGEFVADSGESYIDLGVRLSQDREWLRLLRAGMRDRMARFGLNDARRLMRELEETYRTQWRRWCARQTAGLGLQPLSHISVSTEPLAPPSPTPPPESVVVPQAPHTPDAAAPPSPTAAARPAQASLTPPARTETVPGPRQTSTTPTLRAVAASGGPEAPAMPTPTAHAALQAMAPLAPPQVPPASRPAEASVEGLHRRMATFPYWYHRIELPGGVVTPGWAPLNRDAYRIPADLTGKRVLDVGAWDGFWTFAALERRARQVVAIDDFSDYLGRLQSADRRGWETFDFCREALGYPEERCQRFDLTVYEVTEQRLGRFDIVFFFGTLYHLRYPLLALDRLAAVCSQEIYVESAILDDFSPYRGGVGHGYPGGQMVAEFYPDDQYGSNATNWWVPTLHCLGHMVRAAGFPNVQGWKLAAAPADLPSCRGFIKGSRAAATQP